MAKNKYLVGIDLGTTNIVASYTNANVSEGETPEIKLLPIAQELAKGAVEKLEVMPSFIFQRLKEKPALPWQEDENFIVGAYAQERGSEVPNRLISSAKSWLCSRRIDPTKPLLPWSETQQDTDKISPLEAVAVFLRHVRQAFNSEFSKDKLEDQKIAVTIPASFDASARDLTVEAAKMAGLNEITLLEEPQAAFYSWLSQTTSPWRKQVKKGDVVLVVDVGGGTTDFSLIEISENNGDLALERVAVGSHILLGGDNMDLTLAYAAKQKLETGKKKISHWQTMQLCHQCRKAKEILLSDAKKASVSVVVSGRGSSVIGGALKTEITRGEVEKALVEGFFPVCELTDCPIEDTESGVREVNLSYAADAGITKHLARFLTSQSANGKEYKYPQAILLNGGVFESEIFKNRLVEVINSWLKKANKPPIKVLDGANLSKAVAKGASYYLIARGGKAVRIRGGVSQSYYLGIESALPAVPGFKPPIKALCVAKMGAEEGTTQDIKEKTFALAVGKTAEFKFFKSNCRRNDEFGQLIDDVDETFQPANSLKLELTPYEQMKKGELIDVTLQSAITEIGTLEIYCRAKNTNHRWKLEFNVRENAD